MISRSIRKRLSIIESRLHGPAPTVEGLRDLIVWATPEVLGAVIDRLLEGSFGAEPARESAGCARCGYSGRPVQKAVNSSDLTYGKSKKKARDVSIQELESAIERSSINILNDAIALAFCELDAMQTLIEIRCPNCGYSALGIADGGDGRTSTSGFPGAAA